MKVLYAYAGPRDAGLEAAILREVRDRWGPAEQAESHEGEGDLTVVTLEVDGDERAHQAVLALRDHDRIVDAARHSFAERL